MRSSDLINHKGHKYHKGNTQDEGLRVLRVLCG
jgi:hypothetical protein